MNPYLHLIGQLSWTPGLSDAWYSKGLVLAGLGRYDESLAEFDKALDIDPGYAPARYSKGLALANIGKYDQSLSEIDRALEIDPGAC